MPKATKRKKEKKADFQKTKLKLGKGTKQQSNNATDTSFKARTIALPQQSINANKDGKLTNSRNLSVSELSLQLRHYSPNVRKDAILGIKEILEIHPVLISTAVGQIIPDVCRVIGDDDAAVRKNVYTLLSWYLPQVDRKLLAPYVNTLILFTASAMSHIYPEVRLSAIKVLDLLIESIPQVTTSGWEKAVKHMASPTAVSASASPSGSLSLGANGSNTDPSSHGERIMSCYLNLLGITFKTGNPASSSSSSAQSTGTSFHSASTMSTDLTPASKLLILKSLKNFLSSSASLESESSIATSEHSTPQKLNCPTWFFRSSFRSNADFERFQTIMRPDLRKKNARLFGIAENTNTTATATLNKKKTVQEDEIAITMSDFHSAEYSHGSLVDVEATAGRACTTSDLFSSLTRAAFGYHHGQDSQPGRGAGAGGVAVKVDRKLPPSTSSASLLFSLLYPTLLATFLDAAPTAFQPDLDTFSIKNVSNHLQNVALSTSAEIIYQMVSLCLVLWRNVGREIATTSDGFGGNSTQRDELAILLGHMAAYFPFSQHGNNASLTYRARLVLIEMDLGYSELVALLAFNRGGGSTTTKSKTKFNLPLQLEYVSSYISELLTTSSRITTIVSSNDSFLPLVETETFISLLPTLWLLLQQQQQQKGTHSLLDCLLDCYQSPFTLFSTKSILFEFLARIWLVSDSQDKLLDGLIKSIPKTLWQSISHSNSHVSCKLIEFLHLVVVTTTTTTTISTDTLNQVKDQLVPLFSFNHPTKGIQTVGRFTKLSKQDRQWVLAILQYLYPTITFSSIHHHHPLSSSTDNLVQAVHKALTTI